MQARRGHKSVELRTDIILGYRVLLRMIYKSMRVDLLAGSPFRNVMKLFPLQLFLETELR
jgi:hypothetical protein